MSLSSFLANLVIPLNLCITLLVIAVVLLMLRRRRIAAVLAALGLAWALFWSLPASSLWAGGRLEQLYPYTAAAQLPPAQAIVVLGGHTAGGRPNWFEPYERETALTRTDSAIRLYRAERAPLILLSGAALDGSQSEAESMANTLKKNGVPDQALLLEKSSFNTYENAVYSARILKELGITRVLLVTSALHMPRAMAVFSKQGLTPIAAPSAPQIVVPDDTAFSFWLPDERSFFASRSIIKEYAGLLVYWLRGWI
ncbi:MAG TPA: YdcF family protein [Pusillimonas sp.]|uniref:YdcF family protein n=1 Tax=Pusillimonas sp. TaxID=3040095 RepID=UPI002D003FAC|nr:YdcF family protein [Pusillimonas sp.]HUH88693.1 YdcF family protein [Pusillimonas sp.]